MNKKTLKKYTLSKIWIAFLHRVLQIELGKLHYLRLEINIDVANKELEGFVLPVKELTYEDFLTGNKDIFKGKKLELIKYRLKDPNYKAFGIIENNKLIYSTWISLTKLGLSVETKEIMLNSDEGLLEDSFCDYTARGRGLHGKMNYWRIKKLHELGKRKVIAIVLDGNTPAFKVQYKCGFKNLGTFYNGYIFGFKVNSLNKKKFDNIEA